MSNNSAKAQSNVNNVATESFKDKAQSVASVGYDKFKAAAGSELAREAGKGLVMGACMTIGYLAVTHAYAALSS